MRIIIVGAGGQAQVIADALLKRKMSGESIDVIGFLDDELTLKGKNILDLPVVGSVAEHTKYQFDNFIVGIGDNRIRKRVFDKFVHERYSPFTVIHPNAVVAHNVMIGAGTVIFAGAIINAGSIIGQNVIINTGATVDHHANIASHVHIAPGCHLGGTVTVGEGAFLGIGTNVCPNLSIGQGSIIGAGSTIISSIASNVTAVGTPAKIIKNHSEMF